MQSAVRSWMQFEEQLCKKALKKFKPYFTKWRFMAFNGFTVNVAHFHQLCGLSLVVTIEACLALLGLGAIRQSLDWSWWNCSTTWSPTKQVCLSCRPRYPRHWRHLLPWSLMIRGLRHRWCRCAIFSGVELACPSPAAFGTICLRNFKEVSKVGCWIVAVRSPKMNYLPESCDHLHSN